LLAAGQRDRGYHVIVAAVVDDLDTPFLNAARADGLDVEPVYVTGRAYARERRVMRQLLDRVKPFVVHSHGFRTDLADLPVARRLRIPTVSTLHGFTHGDWKVRLYERLQLRGLRHVSAVIAVSRGVEQRALAHRIPRDRLHRIPNAYAPSPMLDRAAARTALGLSDTSRHFAWIGRLGFEKGADVAVDAMARLTDIPVSLSILGDGPERAALEARTIAQGLNVRFHGRVDNAARLLPAFDGCVLSSRLEGTPMVLLEAMAAQVPIVATTVGGVPDMLTPDEAALVEPESPIALSSAIRELYDSPRTAAERAARAAERVARDFSVGPWLDRHDALYERLHAARSA
jgi:glycosyltransferase involved in cell wall biosynthesis